MRFGGSLLRSGLCVIALVFWSSVLFSADLRDLARLRSPDPLIAALMADANRRSMTFHELVEDIAQTDGLVYVETGHCGHGVRACVPHSITRSGPFRLLHILIDPHDARNGSAAEVSGIIAHELQHALEILFDPTVTNAAAMFAFYHREPPAHGVFETYAAILTGDRVSREIAATGSVELLAKGVTDRVR